MVRNVVDPHGVRGPDQGADPIRFSTSGNLPRLTVGPVEYHQPKLGALVSRTLLGAVGDVAAVGRIERRRVAGGIVGGEVLGRPAADRDDPEIIVGGSGGILVVIQGGANLLPDRREGVAL